MAGTGILSKDITLGYKATSSGSYTVIPDLQEIPELGGSPENVEVTTLADANRRYIRGIQDFGDLTFTFLYDNEGETSSYRILRGLEEAGTVVYWEVGFPDGTKFQFTGQVSTAIQGAGVNAALQFNANISLNSDITVVNA